MIKSMSKRMTGRAMLLAEAVAGVPGLFFKFQPSHDPDRRIFIDFDSMTLRELAALELKKTYVAVGRGICVVVRDCDCEADCLLAIRQESFNLNLPQETNGDGDIVPVRTTPNKAP